MNGKKRNVTGWFLEGAHWLSLALMALLFLVTLQAWAKLRPFSLQTHDSQSTETSQQTESSPVQPAPAQTDSGCPHPKRKSRSSCPVAGTPVCCPPQVAPADSSKAVSDAIAKLEVKNKELEDEHNRVLDRLVTLVGAYSFILGLTAYFSLKSARDEAQAQLELSRKQLADQVSLASTQLRDNLTLNNTQLQNHLKAADDQIALKVKALEERVTESRAQWEEFRKKIWSELPDMRMLHDGLHELVYDLQDKIPDENNWNDEESYKALNEAQRQEILMAEATIAALPTLLSRDSPYNKASLAELYRALARFYAGRFRAKNSDEDAARSEAYITRSLKEEPGDAVSLRMRGATALARQRLAHGGMTKPLSQAAIDLLDRAKADLEQAIAKDKNELGAYYNLAIADARLDHVEGGVELVRAVLARLDDFPPERRRKYLHSLVLNQACDLNALARKSTADADRDTLRKEAFQVLVDGIARMKADRDAQGIAALKVDLDREFKAKGDLDDLDPASQDTLRKSL